ncbi:MAG: hypothetical protein GY931_03850 [Maribacter sp.]|nr:hypothetical protein [Maribacter sp.]
MYSKSLDNDGSKYDAVPDVGTAQGNSFKAITERLTLYPKPSLGYSFLIALELRFLQQLL